MRMREKTSVGEVRNGFEGLSPDPWKSSGTKQACPRHHITCKEESYRPKSHRSTNLVSKKARSEEHTSELQSRPHLVCRLLLEKKKTTKIYHLVYHVLYN